MKKILYSRTLFVAFELPAMLTYKLAGRFNKRFLWCLFFAVAKLQITIGYRSGEFSYLTCCESSLYWFRSIEKRIIDTIPYIGINDANCRSESSILFATSFIARTGGHTRLLQTYLNQMPEAKLLVSGDAFFAGRKKFLEDQKILLGNVFQDAKNRVILNQASSLMPCTQIELLYQHLATLRPNSVVLFNEPSDLALLVAVLNYVKHNDDVRVYYYHHADDFLPLLGGAFHAHIDLDSNQDIKCKDVVNRSLIRISTKNRKRKASTTEPFTVFSFVPFTKIKAKDSGKNSYAGLVSSLSREGIKIIIATRPGESNDLINILKSHGATLSYVHIDEECFDILKYAGAVHAYLDTFPRGGGMSVIDGLSLGIPVIINGHDGNQVFRDPVLDRFMFSDACGMLSYINKLRDNPLFYEQQCDKAYEIFLRNYDEAAMVRSLSSLINPAASNQDKISPLAL